LFPADFRDFFVFCGKFMAEMAKKLEIMCSFTTLSEIFLIVSQVI